MTINKVRASDYGNVKSEWVVDYIQEYLKEINIAVNGCDNLKDLNKNQLNCIAAELETVRKRLDYIVYGRYWDEKSSLFFLDFN